ncbi:MAG: hypothetical protein IJN56_09045 [Clostridia bacterium]|nr:hypothetical protein [Clostridia bacterium]
MSLEMFKDEIKATLDVSPKYRDLLFRRGYIFTDKPLADTTNYPFYGLWNQKNIGSYYLYVQQSQTVYSATQNGISAVIIGHAYNPFDMKYDENEICLDLISAYSQNIETYFDKVSELTGLHIIILIDGQRVIACQDACSLTGCYFGKVNDTMYITEHPQLVADICNLKINKKVEKLVQSKCYNIGNRNLPGNITPYDELKRLGANTYLNYDGKFEIKRFYPTMPHPEFVTEEEKTENIKKIGDLINRGIECCSKKWNRCTISLSGGTDSKTTLACANGLYDKFSYFSFYSKPQELVDAKGAAKICENLGLEHTLYNIPQENSEIKDFDFIKKILQHNTNYFVNLADNEIRKYIYLNRLDAYDIELKSWASEVARVFFERKYKIKMPKRLNERHLSIFQTRFFGHPVLLRWSDSEYYKFLREIGLENPMHNFEHTDLIYWEVRMASWGVSVVSSQQLYHRTTMPMNNRKILEFFLSFPHEERKSDSVHKRIMEYKNKAIVESEVEIANLYFHGYRILMEKVYFYLRTLFYRSKK